MKYKQKSKYMMIAYQTYVSPAPHGIELRKVFLELSYLVSDHSKPVEHED